MIRPWLATSARHWSSAIWTQVEPAPLTDGPSAAAGLAGARTRHSTAATGRSAAWRIRRRMASSRHEPLAEVPVDVVRGPRVLRPLEDVLGRTHLDDPARLVLGRQEE